VSCLVLRGRRPRPGWSAPRLRGRGEQGELTTGCGIPAATVALGQVSIVCRGMFSHVVIFWTDPGKPDASAELIAAAKKYLPPIPGIVNFHIGNMATSHRDVVDQTYQVALNIQFQSKQAQDEYQDHPQHLEFVKQCKPLFAKVVVYDFE